MSTHVSDSGPGTPGRPSVPAAVRQRLEKLSLRARASFERGDCDYAHDLLAQCVAEDPANPVYVRQFRANLSKKHRVVKRGSALGSLLSKSGRGAIDKAAGKGAWQEAFAAGCAALKRQPGDIGALQALAAAAGERGFHETQLLYLRWALDLEPTNLETNRRAGRALAAVREFDQAIACWQRVQKQKPGDEESAKQLARLSVEKTIHVGGYTAQVEAAEEGEEVRASHVAQLAAKRSDGAPRQPGAEDTTGAGDNLEARLLAKLQQDPANTGASRELAAWYAARDRLTDADRVLVGALSASPGDEDLRAAREDLHLQKARQQVQAARDRLAQQDTPEHRELLKRMAEQASRAELEVYAARAKRAPGDTRLRFELGVRQKRLGHFREAIQSFQAARGDRQRLAETNVFLGECFHHIEQYKLAMSSYEAAIDASDGSDGEVRKLALYRAGVLATGLKDYDQAEQRLTELAGLDFGYRDVARRLDKLAAIRDSP